jgi:hypothetical protein
LDPSINKSEYTAEEDRIIIESQVVIGNCTVFVQFSFFLSFFSPFFREDVAKTKTRTKARRDKTSQDKIKQESKTRQGKAR